MRAINVILLGSYHIQISGLPGIVCLVIQWLEKFDKTEYDNTKDHNDPETDRTDTANGKTYNGGMEEPPQA